MICWIALGSSIAIGYMIWVVTKEARQACYEGCCVPNAYQYRRIHRYHY